MKVRALGFAGIVVAAVVVAACGRPGVDSLRESFAQQLASNRFIEDFQREGKDLTFSGPDAEGSVARWRVHIDSTAIEPSDDPAQPYKGVVRSSWYSDDQLVRPSGRESNLPIQLIDNGLGQECWAFWDKATKRWSWE